MIGLISRDVPSPFPKPPRNHPSYSHWIHETERSYQYRCSDRSVPRYTLQRFSRRRSLSCRGPSADRYCLSDTGLRPRCQCASQKTETRR